MARLRLTAVVACGFTAVLAGVAVAAPSPEEKPAPARSGPAGIQLAAKKMPARAATGTPPVAATDAAAPAAAAGTQIEMMPPPVAFEPTKRTLADCMKTWDKDTHMTTAEWKATCIRAMKEADRQEREAKAEQKKLAKVKKKAN
jgi:hypothetical protein